jgi:hypothetical protein
VVVAVLEVVAASVGSVVAEVSVVAVPEDGSDA